MAVFEYHGLMVSTGKTVTGVRDADNPKVLRAILKREGVMLTSAQEEAAARTGSRGKIDFKAFFQRVNGSDIAMMTRQLSTLVGAGIPLVEAVTALQEQVDKDALRRVLSNVKDRLNEGASLAKALEEHPKIFEPLYVNMVAAGEASGTLEQVLDRLAEFMESQSRLKGKVGAALAYPILMIIIGSSLMTLMMIVVVPKVTGIFASLDRALPWYTALLIFVSNTLASNQMLGFLAAGVTMIMGRMALATAKRSGWTIGLIVSLVLLVGFGTMVESALAYGMGVIGGIVAGLLLARFIAFLGTPQGRFWKDSKKLKLPLFGGIFRMLAVARFAQTLSTLLKAGVPLLKAMEIVRHVLDNARLSKVVEEASGAIREGESIATPLKRSGEFPPIVTHMIAVGEKSGQLETMLENVAKAYDSQVETRVQAMTSLLEPLIIVFMGAGVGFIAFSILMPLIQMNDFVQ
jgi:general secretion pathway protein F